MAATVGLLPKEWLDYFVSPRLHNDRQPCCLRRAFRRVHFSVNVLRRWRTGERTSVVSGAPVRVLCWSERTESTVVYPRGIDGSVASTLASAGMNVRVANLNEPGQGLPEAALSSVDVLVWFSHIKHRAISDDVTQRVARHVRERGMGFVPLHSAHSAPPLVALLGTSCIISGWREDDQPANLHVVEPEHPITRGLPPWIVIPQDEMYSERFDVPAPDELVFLSTYSQGEVFRSGCCWTRGKGRIFYFQPGHESLPIFERPEIQRILVNATRWAARQE